MDVTADASETCTLPTAERPTRIAEWDSVFRELVTAKRLDAEHGRLVFRPAPGLEDRVRDLSRRETECCTFFDFLLSPVHDGPFAELDGAAGRHTLVLDVAVPRARADMLDAFVQWAAKSRAEARR